jgi:hypothetical protein
MWNTKRSNVGNENAAFVVWMVLRKLDKLVSRLANQFK